jgi:hypothetical protein
MVMMIYVFVCVLCVVVVVVERRLVLGGVHRAMCMCAISIFNVPFLPSIVGTSMVLG